MLYSNVVVVAADVLNGVLDSLQLLVTADSLATTRQQHGQELSYSLCYFVTVQPLGYVASLAMFYLMMRWLFFWWFGMDIQT